MKVFTTSLLPYSRSIPGFANEQSYSDIQNEEDGEFALENGRQLVLAECQGGERCRCFAPLADWGPCWIIL